MNKKLLIGIGIAILVFVVLIMYYKFIQQPQIIKQELQQKFQNLKTQYEEAKAQGYNVSEVERLGKEAKIAFDKGDYKRANELLEKAKDALEKIKTSKTPPTTTPSTPPATTSAPTTPAPETLKEEARKKLSQVKVAVLYESITHGISFGGRDLNDTIKIFKETHTDFIFRGFWRWYPAPETPDTIPSELLEFYAERTNLNPNQIPEIIRKSGYNYEQFNKSISAIKKEIPDIIFCGGVPTQRINRVERNEITGRIYGAEETWKMALDPQKWNVQRNGKPVTKEEFQKWFAGVHQWVEQPENYDKRKVEAYFPDITNPDFQELFLSWAKKQIDSGVDAIRIDTLFWQATMLYQITNDLKHPAVKESLAASSKIVDEIHKYGESKGKYIYVGAWYGPFIQNEKYPYSPPNLDFVTMSPSNDEILNMELNKTKWDKEITSIRKVYGIIPMFAYLDWGLEDSQMVMFSQRLGTDEQQEMLRILDDFFMQMGVNFIYPTRGGYMGDKPKILSFGKWKEYDSLAPEFQTYETIKELAQKKAGR